MAGMGLDAALEDVGGATLAERKAKVLAVVRFTAAQVASGNCPRVFFGSMFKGDGFAARLDAYESATSTTPAPGGSDDRDEIEALHREICGR